MDTVSVVETDCDGMVVKLVTYPRADVHEAESLFCQLVTENANVTISEMENLLESGFFAVGYADARGQVCPTIQLVWSTMA